MADSKSIVIESLSGGLDDETPIHQLEQDACTRAMNVEFWISPLGERRLGCEDVSILSSNLDDETNIVYLTEWYPTNDVVNSEVWAIGATPGTSVTFAKRLSGTWSEITPVDPALDDAPNVYNFLAQAGPSSVSPNGKLHWFYPSTANRHHVWDPNNTDVLRRAGLAQPDPPTMSNGVAAVIPTTKRWYRVRDVRQAGVGGTVTLRSEPSDSVVFTPNGTNAPRITAPTWDVNESGTHWEVEGSFNNADFYVLQSLARSTLFWDDTFTDPLSFSEEGPLSEDIGTYLLLPNAKYGIVTDDRLILASHYSDKSLMSTAWWTPVANDPGRGNDERLPLEVTNSISFDNYSGGPITGLGAGILGSWYVFKWDRIYKMGRTNDPLKAYAPTLLTTARGAVPGSIFPGLDRKGNACIFFTDPYVGPCMLGGGGLQRIYGLSRTWESVNTKAEFVIARGCYYPFKSQARWWLATGEEDTPDLGMCLQVTETISDDGGLLKRGWSLFNGTMATALTAAMITEDVTEDGVTTSRKRPWIGLDSSQFIKRCDAQTNTDDGDAYAALIRTRPYFVGGLLNKWGSMCASLFAFASAGTDVAVRLIRDFGKETIERVVPLDAVGASEGEVDEEYVNKFIDDLSMAEAQSIQVEFGDDV